MARTAFLLGGLAMVPGAIICYVKGNENEPFRAMERTATIEAYANSLTGEVQGMPALPAAVQAMVNLP